MMYIKGLIVIGRKSLDLFFFYGSKQPVLNDQRDITNLVKKKNAALSFLNSPLRS
jgi:hypothetical protein